MQSKIDRIKEYNTAEIDDFCFLLFDEDGEKTAEMWYNDFEGCLLVVETHDLRILKALTQAYEYGEESGKALGRTEIRTGMQRLLGLGGKVPLPRYA